MPGDPGQRALDGRANGAADVGDGVVIQDGQELPWRPVELYRRITRSRDRDARRGRGTLGATKGGPKPGTPWRTTSTLDQITVLAEDATKMYVDAEGNDWTLHDMVVELFKDLQARQKAE